MRSLLDEMRELFGEGRGRTAIPGTRKVRKGGVYVKQSDGRWLKQKRPKGKKDPYAGMSIAQINRQRGAENRG